MTGETDKGADLDGEATPAMPQQDSFINEGNLKVVDMMRDLEEELAAKTEVVKKKRKGKFVVSSFKRKIGPQAAKDAFQTGCREHFKPVRSFCRINAN